MKYQTVFNTPIGKIGLVVSQIGLMKLDFLSATSPLISARDTLTQQITTDIKNYFTSSHHIFSSPFDLHITPFQQTVLDQLKKIPPGDVLTYGQIAEKIRSGARAVGNACRKNPVPILIPCHRVIAASGIGGYSGARSGELLDIKQWLLGHEKEGS